MGRTIRGGRWRDVVVGVGKIVLGRAGLQKVASARGPGYCGTLASFGREVKEPRSELKRGWTLRVWGLNGGLFPVVGGGTTPARWTGTAKGWNVAPAHIARRPAQPA